MNLPEERQMLNVIEDRLRRGDPRFAATMTSLNDALSALPADGESRRARWKGILALVATLGTALTIALATPHGSAACTARAPSTPTVTVHDPEQVPVATRQDAAEAAHAHGC